MYQIMTKDGWRPYYGGTNDTVNRPIINDMPDPTSQIERMFQHAGKFRFYLTKPYDGFVDRSREFSGAMVPSLEAEPG